jgi:actin-related protein
VVDGFAFPHVTKRLNVAGRHVTSHLCDLLLRRGYAFNRTADFRTVQDMKVRTRAPARPRASLHRRLMSQCPDKASGAQGC